jgi:hypothetical protein
MVCGEPEQMRDALGLTITRNRFDEKDERLALIFELII